MSSLSANRAFEACTSTHPAEGTKKSSVREKNLAIALSLISILVVLSPIVQNWQSEPMDNFPLSYFPMFSYERSGLERLSYLVGLDIQNNRIPIRYTFAGTGGMNQVRRQINAYVNRNQGDQLCQLVSRGIAERRAGSMSRILSVHVVTGRYDLSQYYSGNKRPVSEQIEASCPVVRRA